MGQGRKDPPASTVADHAATIPAATQEPSQPEGLPTKIGRYRILSELGAGGMGVVYRAHDPELEREVALKRVKRSSRGKPEDTKQRLLREAQAMARLGDPGVVEVYDVGIHAGTVFVAMELVDGMTLARWRSTGPNWREVLRVYGDAGETLAVAHRAGLVHRDFKPHNAMITRDGRVKVLDFGLARQLQGSLDGSVGQESVGPLLDTAEGSSVFDAALTTTGTFVGTPAYMAPEQFDGGSVDARADQFSFCVSLWEALYGARPFGGGTLSELRAALASGPPPAPRARSGIPGPVARVLTQGLSLGRDARFASMDALLEALRASARGSRGWVRIAVPLAGLAAVGVGIGLWDRHTAQGPCEGAQAALGDAWSDSRKGAIEDAVAGSSDPFAASTWERIEPRVDDYAAAWRKTFGEVCRATHVEKTEPPDVLDVRMACLGRARARLDALTEVLATGRPDVLRRGVLAAVSLPPPGACRNEAPRAEGGAAEKEQWMTEQLERLAEAEARASAGDAEAGLALARGALVVAKRRNNPRLQASALIVEGDIRSQLGEHRAAEASIHEGYMLALEADDAEGAARAARALVFIVGVLLARHEEGLEWHRHARAQQDRAPRDVRAEAALASNLGALRGEMGDFAASTRHLETARELEESILAPDDPRLSATYFNLAHALSNQGEKEAALRYARRAIDIVESTYGREHPQYGKALGQVCMALEQQGRYEESLPMRQQADVIAQAAYPDPHPTRANSRWGLAKAHAGAGAHERALELLEEAKAMHIALLGEEHPTLGGLLNDIAGSLHALGREAEAFDALKAALAIEEGWLGEDHPDLAMSLSNVGTVARELGRPEEAIAAYQRATRVLEAAPGHDETAAARIQHNLAKAFHDAERWDDAWRTYESVIPKLSAALGAASAPHRSAIAGGAIALTRLGRAAEAAPLVARGLELSGEQGDDAAGNLHYAMAVVLSETGGDRRSAHESADRARTIFDGSGNREGVARVDRWRSAHDDSPSGQPKRP